MMAVLAAVEWRLIDFDPGRYRTPAAAKAQRMRLENWRRRLAWMIKAMDHERRGDDSCGTNAARS